MAASTEPKSGSFSKRSSKLHKPILSLDHGTTSSRTPKSSGNHNIFARLQAHFLPHVASPPAPPAPVVVAKTEALPEPPYIKVRIITWNMNESLPKGDLAPLLGSVPPYEVHPNTLMDLNIPGLSLDPDHPCHIVVVAGQECPTLMGLPMGLGGGLKWDKDEDEKKKDKKDEDKKKKDNYFSVEQLGTPTGQGSRTPITPGARTPSKAAHHLHHNVGWSAILEDYFSRGIGSVKGARQDLKTPLPNQSLSSLLSSPQYASDNKEAKWTVPAGSGEVPKVGLYELLTKERMMGIYIAVYVHRDVRPLVEGYSQSSVAAGLMRGRLGNKGGVAVSLKISGTTFLFLGAHLAAHADKQTIRLANMEKIKAELAVDDFLPPDDERKRSEDPTDRFDHTFLCGDLNFRLDITRLHAEWLIGRREYAQALEFDQLRKIMKSMETHAFVGFQEAVIDFPPTFKYDILQTLKGGKRIKKEGKLKQRALSEVEERAQEEAENTPQSATASKAATPPNEEGEESEDSNEASEDTISSSEDEDDEEERGVRGTYDSRLGKKAKHVAKKVKRRWWGILKSTTSLPLSPPKTPGEKDKKVTSSASNVNVFSESQSIIAPSRSATLKSPPSATRATSSMDVPRRSEFDPRPGQQLARSATITSASVSKTTLKTSENEPSVDIQDKGVYDTSYKQRVPSWCDRILFKSTAPISASPIEIVPPTAVIVGHSEPPRPPSRAGISKMGSLLQALKPRSRAGSATTETKATTSSTGTDVAVPVPPLKSVRHSQNHGPAVPLTVVTTLGREEDSPIAISNSATSPATSGLPIVKKDETGDRLRSSTAPDMARTGSTASDRLTTLRLEGKRRRSLSATLPRTSEPVEITGKGIPASASTPPVVPLISPDAKDDAGRPSSRLGRAEGGAGRALGLRRIMSLIPGSWGHSHSPPAPPPNTAQTLVVQGPPLRVYKKGEIRCLGYQTLSDKEMRRLEGRSDHRPVIGHFAIYV